MMAQVTGLKPGEFVHTGAYCGLIPGRRRFLSGNFKFLEIVEVDLLPRFP